MPELPEPVGSGAPFAEPQPEPELAPTQAVVPAASAPVAAPARVLPAAVAPGWYPEPGTPGVLRYWNGTGWEDWRRPLVAAPSIDQNQKQIGVAYLLAIFLGGLGIYNFYLGRTAAAVVMLVLWLIAWPLLLVGVGEFLFPAIGVWVIIDLFLIPGYVRAANLRAVQPPR